jgi:hypothetical protein
VWCDNTTELLAARLRPGNAGANTTADRLDVMSAAITQIPRTHRKNLLIGANGAGASHGLPDWLTEQNQIRGRRVEYSIGFALTETLRPSCSCPKRCGLQHWTLTAGCVPVVMSLS